MFKLPVKYTDYSFNERRLIREQYIQEQNGLCCFCNNPLKGSPVNKVDSAKINWRLFPVHFQKHPIHLHHSHKTGYTLGAVHMKCNAYLWQFRGE